MDRIFNEMCSAFRKSLSVSRFAITIWYMDREERRKAIEKQAEEAAESDSAQRSNDRSVSFLGFFELFQ